MFGCAVFALQNVLASGSQLPRWLPRTHLRLNLGPSPMHARNVNLVLNLVTGCVSPQYHCHFDDFFKTTRHSAPDVSGTICWQQLANLNCAKMTIFKVSLPIQHNVMYWKNCPITVTLLLCKLMDNHQTCSTPITSPKQKRSFDYVTKTNYDSNTSRIIKPLPFST
jgi:hypothetical protein